MNIPITNPIKIVVKHSGDVRIHTFISSYEGDNIANATHIIESKNVLVLIDGQFLKPYAQKFREYADSLKKPIARLYLSHRHPDHWFGLGDAFADVEIYTLPETIDFLKEHGEASREDHMGKLGDLAPDKVVIPQHAVSPGVEFIDGVQYVIERIIDTEIDYGITLKLPELGVFIAQDLIYSGTHLYLTKYLDHWMEQYEDMLTSDYEIFLPGHGAPADKKEVTENLKYLIAAKQAIDDGLKNQEFKQFMLQKFPTRQCPAIFDIYLPRLFDGASEY
ncbi:MBL fold metallo-hydrolase [Pseudoalteromonas luteoviolacea]|uniref:MBL fold metallo-hydrolase n=1 Tax=Pseudoalteromonas luteoviolacea TaxID=43657 RepID=A0A1C0TTD4_9GAMM|nr:MBL fold metallo-hydrolase [Pseudoalteromonas luteoviolacea]MBQ4811081.1 MBL fold metallo-hydrolase [Pseudoalteromonas luteoviolacea]OCQ22583.1 MBL fold metallo-hydrolase [Pseudoalteromonas luteoviolacea]